VEARAWIVGNAVSKLATVGTSDPGHVREGGDAPRLNPRSDLVAARGLISMAIDRSITPRLPRPGSASQPATSSLAFPTPPARQPRSQLATGRETR
jgi:hypothetical protein